MKTVVTRFTPGTELKSQIIKLAKAHGITAGYVVTCVGGLTEVICRMSGATPTKQDIRQFKGHFEIVSLVGTISTSGCHLHISFSDEQGKVFGGHLKEAIVDPTAELVLGVEENLTFNRQLDDQTGFKELRLS